MECSERTEAGYRYTMTLALLVVAFLAFAVATIGLWIEKSRWVALIALGLALVTLADLWPHFGLH